MKNAWNGEKDLKTFEVSRFQRLVAQTVHLHHGTFGTRNSRKQQKIVSARFALRARWRHKRELGRTLKDCVQIQERRDQAALCTPSAGIHY